VSAIWTDAEIGSHVREDAKGITIQFGTSLTYTIAPEDTDALTRGLLEKFANDAEAPVAALARGFKTFADLENWLQSRIDFGVTTRRYALPQAAAPRIASAARPAAPEAPEPEPGRSFWCCRRRPVNNPPGGPDLQPSDDDDVAIHMVVQTSVPLNSNLKAEQQDLPVAVSPMGSTLLNGDTGQVQPSAPWYPALPLPPQNPLATPTSSLAFNHLRASTASPRMGTPSAARENVLIHAAQSVSATQPTPRNTPATANASSSSTHQRQANTASLPLNIQSMGRPVTVNRDTPLMQAAFSTLGETQLVEHLKKLIPLLGDKDPQIVSQARNVLWAVNIYNDSAFTWAVRRGYAGAVRMILDSLVPELVKHTGELNPALLCLGSPNSQGYPALTVAAKFARAQVAEHILDTLLIPINLNIDQHAINEAMAVIGHTTAGSSNTALMWAFGNADPENGVTEKDHEVVAAVFLQKLLPLLTHNNSVVAAKARSIVDHRNANDQSAMNSTPPRYWRPQACVTDARPQRRSRAILFINAMERNRVGGDEEHIELN